MRFAGLLRVVMFVAATVVLVAAQDQQPQSPPADRGQGQPQAGRGGAQGRGNDLGGRVRKLVSTGARNGYFFTVDRTSSEFIASGKFSPAANWATGLDEHGRPMLNPEKVATIAGAMVSSSATNWPPPAYSPDTGLVYLTENNSLSVRYLIDPDPRGSIGLGGTQNGGGVSTG
jgi:hypothetical protein